MWSITMGYRRFKVMRSFLFLLGSLLIFSCGPSGPSENTLTGEALGTTYSIKYFSEKEIPVEQGLDSIFRVVNRSMSTYQDDSDISRLNRGDSLVRVDSLFQEVFRLSRKVYEESEGLFDPTVGNLVNLYGFGPEKNLRRIDSSLVDSLMAYVGLEKLSLTSEGKMIKEVSGVYLDFNAIAKGYTVDLIGHFLEQHGVDHYLIELGGELLAKGRNLSRDSSWAVGIDDPAQTGDKRSLVSAVALNDRAMATSGNYRKFRVDPETGIRYVHTINPLTGYPEKSRLLSVSVLAENCALADAYATAFMAMGLERSVALLEELEGVDAYLIYAEEGENKEFLTPGFKKDLLEL